MGILENTIGAMLGGQHGGGGQNFGGGAYAPLATALIGLLAAKAMTGGFGNLGGVLGGGQAPNAGAAQSGAGPIAAGGGLLGGLGGLLHQFQQNGQGNLVNSWVGHGPNEAATPQQIRQGLGPDTVNQLAQQTGMSPEQVAAQLSQGLPDLVNRLTPNGRLPTHEEVAAHG